MNASRSLRAKRWVVAALGVGPWLFFLASRQVALYPAFGPLGSQLLPTPIVLGLIVAAVAARALRPTTTIHVIFLAVLTCSIATLAASLGSPLANASGDYCGDFCRDAIMGRFLVFFGWPVVTAGMFAVLARAERGRPGAASIERAAWSRAWAGVTLTLGLIVSIVWWRTILPNG